MPSFTQNSSFWAGAEYGKGVVLVHREKMRHLTHFNPNKIEINIQKQTSGSKAWHKTYNLPKIAYSLLVVDYIEQRLGETYSANIQFIYPYIKKNNIQFNVMVGLGAGYNTHPFDREKNNQNNVLGSRITGNLYLKSNVEFNISPILSSYLALGVTHFSNGAVKLPNLGINVPYVSVGFNYKLADYNDKIMPITTELTNKKIHLAIDFSNGWKDVVYSGGKRHWFNVLTFKTHFNTSNINRLTLGADFFYDRSVNEFRTNFGLENNKNRNFKSAILIGHELKISKVYAVINYGVYLYQAYNNVYARAYQRYQIKYKFYNEMLYCAAGLKVHKGVADVIECTIGLEL